MPAPPPPATREVVQARIKLAGHLLLPVYCFSEHSMIEQIVQLSMKG